eukprot:Plantae.Rhodophyta-Hildenbrandia_rubra.ctg6748.p1 GENE.Plantae.Rhodophyta-Hildenbrandia_rubra.ctg6748~~Plantae.Rhodophyta-Hildenbrandia_rubra.ctg6748.p1  ORF type:complete len:377 (+),score=59.08 Plantae.Rhodophyta-Hildenbrandia_rubra.ctg6748:408-1538(+)
MSSSFSSSSSSSSDSADGEKYVPMVSMESALATIRGRGDFACGGPALGLPTAPGLRIRNYGFIGLPLGVEEAQKLASSSLATQAPFGNGDKTVVDTTVRRTWQYEPKDVEIVNGKWNEGVDELVKKVGFLLGTGYRQIVPVLYKVLMYENGGFFKSHCDTEKEERMFATLIVQLPSDFEGGDLVVRHDGDERTFRQDTTRGSVNQCFYTANYADCDHKLSPITSGVRLAIVYSLCWEKSDEEVWKAPPNGFISQQTVNDAMKNWLESGRLAECNIYRGYNYTPSRVTRELKFFLKCLKFRYTINSLSRDGLNALKGSDAGVANALFLACQSLSEKEPSSILIAQISRTITVHDGFLGEHDMGVESFPCVYLKALQC